MDTIIFLPLYLISTLVLVMASASSFLDSMSIFFAWSCRCALQTTSAVLEPPSRVRSTNCVSFFSMCDTFPLVERTLSLLLRSLSYISLIAVVFLSSNSFTISCRRLLLCFSSAIASSLDFFTKRLWRSNPGNNSIVVSICYIGLNCTI